MHSHIHAKIEAPTGTRLGGSLFGAILDEALAIVELKPAEYCTAMSGGRRCSGEHIGGFHTVRNENGVLGMLWTDEAEAFELPYELDEALHRGDLEVSLECSPLNSITVPRPEGVVLEGETVSEWDLADERRGWATTYSGTGAFSYAGALAGTAMAALMETFQLGPEWRDIAVSPSWGADPAPFVDFVESVRYEHPLDWNDIHVGPTSGPYAA